MIERYTNPEMGQIWTEDNKFRTWLKVEIALVQELVRRGEAPQEDLDTIREKANFDVQRILEIEAETHHDVIAFLTNLAEYVGPASRHIHKGMTSSDLLDTSTGLLMREAGFVLRDKLQKLHGILGKRAMEFRDTFQMGRTHGIHAELITFGYKLALWREEVGRNLKRLDTAIDSISVGKISGAVGTYQHLPPEVEANICAELELKPAGIANQVIQRDCHAEFLTTLALIAASIEKFSVEIRHMQRSELREAEEFFSKGQKGSSAMPHKRNPIISERLTGIARLLRGNAHTAMENVALWHERDISHSSVERVIIPDSCIILDYGLSKLNRLLENLIVYPENMRKNIDKSYGLIFSQEVLIALVNTGLTREDSYKLVQQTAMKAWENGLPFKDLLLENETILQHLSAEKIESIFDESKVLINIQKVFEKLGLV